MADEPIITREEAVMLTAVQMEEIERATARAAGMEASRDPWQGLPSAADREGLLAAIDHAITILEGYNNPDLQYCVGYLAGFRELLKRTREGR